MARLPVYLRSLLELADGKVSTISSERLAEMAGVNAAKVRKDLSYLGSYGTRGVGYDVEYLLFQMSRELGLTQDWPVVIVGIGNLGQALANYGGFTERGFPVAALVDADPAKVGTEFLGLTIRPLDDLGSIARDATRHDRDHRDAGARGPGRRRPARRRGDHVDPQLRAGGDLGARPRPPCARSTSPSSCRSSPSTSSSAASAAARKPPRRTDRRRGARRVRR